MDSNDTHGTHGTHAKDKRSDDSDAKSKDNTPTAANTPTDSNKSPRKRRKVNHACVYCRRSHMTCDLPKGSNHASARDESDAQVELSRNSIDRGASTMVPTSFEPAGPSQGNKTGFGPLGQGNHLQLVSQSPVSGLQASTHSSNTNQLAGFSDAWLTAQNQFHDMHHYNPQYMLPQEVTHEFNLLNDFLNTSLLDESGNLADEQDMLYRNHQPLAQSGPADVAGFIGGDPLPPSAMEAASMPPPSAERTSMIQRQKGSTPADKTREFYLQAADPSGNDTPEARMQKVLKAKYDAGLLRPFNYVNGYKRLSNYMDGHIAPASKQKILRQLDRFRPMFREKVQGLTDMELVYVEMWFERTLLVYDRVFASMAVPACCWRRSGEIFRGNKEMAELIHVPVERLRDGKISLHEVMTEESLVRYWEEFGTIAFDAAHETLFTACALKNPDDRSNDPIVNCCFSFMIRRDDHKINLREQPLAEATETTLQSLSDELEAHINALTIGNGRSLGTQNHAQLHTAGVSLWNWCTQEKRGITGSDTPSKDRLFVLVRVMSFSVLSLSLRNDETSPTVIIQLVKIAIKTARCCIAQGEFAFALWVLQKAVDYNGLLQRLQSSSAEDLHTCSQLEADYTTLRIVLAWEEDRIDVAEHLYGTAEKVMRKLTDPASAEKLADALFEIGRGLAKKKNSVLAVKWLERAHELLNAQDLDRLSRDALELRLAISQALVQVYLDMRTPDYFDRAENHVAYIESELGDKLIVLLLRIELLLSSPAETFDSDAYAGILRRMMKIALKQEDIDYSLKCLEQIRTCTASSPQYLYACCLEAQKAQDKISTIEALRYLVLNYNSHPHSSSNIHLPALLRTLIRLEVSVLNDEERINADRDSLVEDLCQIFKTAVEAIEKEWRECRGDRLFTIDELNWFCKNAYNLGLEKATVWEARHVVRIFECCLSVLSCYPADIPAQTAADCSLRGMFCNFMAALVLLALARSGDNTEQQLQDYLDMRRHIQQFHNTLESRSGGLEGDLRDDLDSKLSTLLDDLKGIILKTQLVANVLTYQAMGDCILRCDDVPAKVLYRTIRELVTQIWEVGGFDGAALAKYLRCLIKATLPMENEVALDLVKKICDMVEKSVDFERPFPDIELEWITITVFNHGVDLSYSHEEELSKAWTSHSLTLAHQLQDGGKLERKIQQNLTMLKWDPVDTDTG
ncbi:meiosis protein SPO22/ZIP4 like-domain-containing protein [Poronia punctata]|nr:meiosis protein SPO22/ZIP4 like-domain-containing protein [Poronia punctata]